MRRSPTISRSPPKSSTRAGLHVAALYAALGVTWLILSNLAVSTLIEDPANVARWKTLTAWLFVVVSTGALFLWIERSVAAQRRTENRLETVLRHSPIVLWSTDRNGIVTLAEGKGLEGLDREPGSVGYSVFERYADVPEIVEAHRRALAGDTFFVTIRLGDRVFESNYAPLRRRGEVVGMIGVANDITQRTELERRVHQSEKMEAIGRLAGGVAHDFNNVLAAISGHTEILLYDVPAGDPRRADLAEIKKAVDRAATLTRQLLAFSRQQPLEPQSLSLNQVVAEIETMLRRLLTADIDLETALAEDLGRVRADRGQLEQVIVNLAVNARDAMPEGGKLTIETANVDLREVHARDQEVIQPGTYVMLAVSDTGTGMDKPTQARIFEPFFSTKEKGHGTGLGLSTVYGIVKQSGGHIWLYSEPGYGTSFKIYLPRIEKSAANPHATPASVDAPKGTETLLIVEDEAAIRAMAVHVLTECGYHVIQAENGHDAIAMIEDQGNERSGIDLLVTDAVLPWYSGRELSRRVRAISPRTKVLFISGYSAFATTRHGVLEPGAALLPKPFTPAALAQKVRVVLDSR